MIFAAKTVQDWICVKLIGTLGPTLFYIFYKTMKVFEEETFSYFFGEWFFGKVSKKNFFFFLVDGMYSQCGLRPYIIYFSFVKRNCIQIFR